MPFFSIIIPLYNKEKFIAKTVQSVLNQTFVDFEIIIINDGSTDDSLKTINELTDSRIKIFTTKNNGVSFARNYGLEKACGEFIVFLDADDIFEKEHLNKLLRLITDFPNAEIYCTNYLTKYSKNSIKKIQFKGLTHGFRGYINDFFRISVFHEILRIGNAAIKTNILIKPNMRFDEDMKSGQDTDLWIRIGLYHKTAIDTTALTLVHQKTNNSLSSSLHVNNRILMLDKYKEFENENLNFKKYMDLNRYAIALNYRINKKHCISQSILKDIDCDHLNIKQKLLIKTPVYITNILLKIKLFMDRNGIFISLYK